MQKLHDRFEVQCHGLSANTLHENNLEDILKIKVPTKLTEGLQITDILRQ